MSESTWSCGVVSVEVWLIAPSMYIDCTSAGSHNEHVRHGVVCVGRVRRRVRRVDGIRTKVLDLLLELVHDLGHLHQGYGVSTKVRVEEEERKKEDEEEEGVPSRGSSTWRRLRGSLQYRPWTW